MRRILVAVLLVVAAVGCSSDGDVPLGEAQVDVDGVAEVRSIDGQVRQISGSERLGAGDLLTMVSGTARVRMAGGLEMAARAGRGEIAPTKVIIGNQPLLRSGSLLVTTDRPATVLADSNEVIVERGVTKIESQFGVIASSYEGVTTVNSAGIIRTVKGLRQVAIPTIGLPDEIEPLQYDKDDPWDRELLGEAIALGEELEAQARGYTASLRPTEARTASFFRRTVPGLSDQDGFTAQVVDLNRSAGETVVGALIATLGRQGTFTERWAAVFEFRAAGAQWGLVALDQGVARGPLLDGLDAVLAGSNFVFGADVELAIPDDPVNIFEPAPPTSAPQQPGPGTTTPPPTNPGPGPTTPPDDGSPTDGLPVDPGEIIDPIDTPADVVDEVVNGLLGL